MNKKQLKRNVPVIAIGCSKESVQTARYAIYDILASPSCDAAKVEALKALATFCAVSGPISIAGCNIQG